MLAEQLGDQVPCSIASIDVVSRPISAANASMAST
jgi:hypothetical protein